MRGSDKLRRWPLPSTILRPTSPSSASPSFSSPFSLTLLLRNLEPKRLLHLIFCFFGCIHPVARHLAAQTTHANQPKWWCWREVVVVLAATIAHNQSRPWLGNCGKGVTLFFLFLSMFFNPQSLPELISTLSKQHQTLSQILSSYVSRYVFLLCSTTTLRIDSSGCLFLLFALPLFLLFLVIFSIFSISD